MKKLLSLLSSVITLVFFLAIGFVASLPFWIRWSHVKAPLLSFVERAVCPRQWDLKLNVEEAHIRWGRSTTLTLRGFSARQKGQDETPLSFKEMQARLNLKSLLTGHVRGQVLLVEPALTLSGLTPTGLTPTGLALKGPFPSWMSALILEKMEVKDGSFAYASKRGLSVQLDHLNIQLLHLNLGPPNQPTQLTMTGNLSSALGQTAQGQAFQLEGRLHIDVTHQKIRLEEASLQLPHSSLQLSGEWSPEGFSGTLQMQEMNLALQDFFAKPAGTPLSLHVEGSQSNEAWLLDKIEFHLADVEIKGTGKIPLAPQKPGEFSLETNPINLAEILPFVPRWQNDPLGGTVTLKLDLSGPATDGAPWNYGIRLSADSLRLWNFNMGKVTALLSLAPPRLTIKSLDAVLNDLPLAGSGGVDFSGPQPAWDMDLALTNVSLESVSRQFAGLPGAFSGQGSLLVKATGTGRTWEEIRPTLSGEGKMAITQGAWRAEGIIRELFSPALGSLLTLAPPLFLQQLKPIALGNLEIPLTLNQGVAHFASLHFADEHQSLELSGWVNLDQQINMAGQYSLNKIKTDSWITNPKLRSFLVDSAGQFRIPFTLTGALASPTVSADLSYVRARIGQASPTPETQPETRPETRPGPLDNIDRNIEAAVKPKAN